MAEKKNYEDLVSTCKLDLTHLTLEILGHRELFERNFSDIYTITKRELATKSENEEIHERIFGNWVIPLATFRTLETVIDVPFTYTDLFNATIKGIRNQNELAQESSEVADFWNMLQGFQTSGKCVEKAHYLIRYQKKFRPYSVNEAIEFPAGSSSPLFEHGCCLFAIRQPLDECHRQPFQLVNHRVVLEITLVIPWLKTREVYDTFAKRLARLSDRYGERTAG